VVTVRVAVTGVAPLMVTDVAVQAGAGLALVAMEQVRFTVPRKPPDGVMLVVKVAELPAVTVIDDGEGDDIWKPPPPAPTVRLTEAE